MNLSNKIKETADEFIDLIKNNDYKQEKISAQGVLKIESARNIKKNQYYKCEK